MSNEYPFASMRDSFDLSAYFVVGSGLQRPYR